MDNKRIQQVAEQIVSDWILEAGGLQNIMKEKHITRKPTKLIKKWAKTSLVLMKNTIGNNVSASEELSIFPYNYDSILDDTIITTPISSNDSLLVLKNYLQCYEQIARLAVINQKMFGTGATEESKTQRKTAPVANARDAVQEN